MSEQDDFDFLKITPQEFEFPFRLHKEMTCSFHILNTTKKNVAFMVYSKSPEKYVFSPDHGLMKPGSDLDIVVTMNAQTKNPYDKDWKEYVKVESFIPTRNATVNSINDVINIQKRSNSANTLFVTLVFLQDQSEQKAIAISTQNAQLEDLFSKQVQISERSNEEVAKLRKELEVNKNLVKELQQKLGYTEFTYEELKQASDGFACKLGEGGFSVVYKGTIINKDVAIKKLTLKDEKGFKEEIETLSKLRHPNIITLVGACTDKMNPVLVYEYLAKGSLEDHLNREKKHPPLPGHTRIRIAVEISCALSFLHNIPRAHGDIKPDNILLDSNYVSKLSDFGTCRKLEYTANTKTPSHFTQNMSVTTAYMDPDSLASPGLLTPWFDIYSFGVVLLRLATGKDVIDQVTRMPIRELVERKIHTTKFHELVDIEWPYKEVPEKMARLALTCFLPSYTNPCRPHAAELFISLMDIASNYN